MKNYKFKVTYTNDTRNVEVKARSESEAKYLLEIRAKKALMIITSIDLLYILN
jgi:hypothetical protein